MRKPLSLEQIMKEPSWNRLTRQQRLFCRVCVETSDPTFAYQQAYSANSMEMARVKSYAILANPNVRAVMNRIYRRTKKELALEEVERILRSKKASAHEKEQAFQIKLDILRGSISRGDK